MARSESMTARVTMPFDCTTVEAQLRQLTLVEKISLLGGAGFVTTAPIDRLGISSMKLVEGINGVKDALQIDSGEALTDVLAGKGPTTVCFPGTSSMGSTWNVELMDRLGSSIGSQAKEKQITTIMGPGLNIHRDPRGGRNFEYFSEDPYLSGALAGSLVNGIQREGVGACPKHFVANDAENYRRRYNVGHSINSREVREISMSAFGELLRRSNPVCLMTSYNKIDGIHCSESPMLDQILRKEWGFEGAIMSDWFGTHSTVESILAGQDLEMPGPPAFRGKKLLAAVAAGSINENQIDQRAEKMLQWIQKTTQPCSKSRISRKETIDLARQIATEGMVLLKNNNNILPLDVNSGNKVAVVGTPAINPPMNGGGSSLAPPQYVQKPFDCIRDAYPLKDLVTYAGGVKCDKILPCASPDILSTSTGAAGVEITYYNRDSCTPVLREVQPTADVVMLHDVKCGLDPQGFHYVITTNLTPATSGKHEIGVQATGAYYLYMDRIEILSSLSPDCTIEDFLFVPSSLEKSCTQYMEVGQSYEMRLVVESATTPPTADAPTPHAAKLCFLENYSDDRAIQQALEVVQQSDISIIFAGRNYQYESEGFDMDDILLPSNQARLVKEVAQASKRSVLVLNCGGPIDVSDFENDVDAILFLNYAGQEGGTALADILVGNQCPSGRLATSWPVHIEDVATFNHFPARECKGQYVLPLVEGLEVGYRRNWPTPPRFPFGYGLSYTTFQYSNLIVTPAVLSRDSLLLVTVTVANTGSRGGHEVIQVYVSDISSSQWRPVKELKGFRKVWLEPQTSQFVDVRLNLKSALSFWDEETLMWKAESGLFAIQVGSQTSTVELKESFSWLGL